MREIGVDPVGIEIMAPKTVSHLVRVNHLPVFAAHILKQEALSLGGDTAVSREALTGKSKYTDCLIVGNLIHIKWLCEKLKRQPYKLAQLAVELQKAIGCYQRSNFVLELGSHRLDLHTHTHIMGIINMTPDSFSGDGLLRKTSANAVWRAKDERRKAQDVGDYAKKLVDDGADILDIGGESSRPGAKAITVKEELARVIPAIKMIRKKVKAPISVDTYKAEVARQALDNGAHIVNDITALSGDPKMAGIIKKYKAAVVLMHMKGSPRTMQKNPHYRNIMQEIVAYLQHATTAAVSAGIDPEKIIIDPGVGFGKRVTHNLEIIKSLGHLRVVGRPILVGASRKSFIGNILNQAASGRLAGTISANCIAVYNGAKIVRVHDVKESKQALTVLDSILKC